MAALVHNALVVAGFGLLPIYVATLSLLRWRNGLRGPQVIASLGYMAVLVGYLALIVFGPRLGTPHGHMVQVIGQKLVAGASVLFILVLTTGVASALEAAPRAPTPATR